MQAAVDVKFRHGKRMAFKAEILAKPRMRSRGFYEDASKQCAKSRKF